MANKLYNQKTVASVRASVGASAGQRFTYKGFNSRNTKGGFKQYDTDLVKQDLLNHFHIRKGQKLENPEFGTIIWDMLFEPMTDSNKRIITEDVEKIVNTDPRVRPTSVQIDATEHGIRIEISMVYLPFNVADQLILDFDDRNLSRN